jgi:hypothetical protein
MTLPDFSRAFFCAMLMMMFFTLHINYPSCLCDFMTFYFLAPHLSGI